MDITIIYRENDLFTAYMPMFVSLLSKQGHSVSTIAFSQELSQYDIKRELVERPEDFTASNLIMDNTCSPDIIDRGGYEWNSVDVNQDRKSVV